MPIEPNIASAVPMIVVAIFMCLGLLLMGIAAGK
jgi:hypothetical protein